MSKKLLLIGCVALFLYGCQNDNSKMHKQETPAQKRAQQIQEQEEVSALAQKRQQQLEKQIKTQKPIPIVSGRAQLPPAPVEEYNQITRQGAGYVDSNQSQQNTNTNSNANN